MLGRMFDGIEYRGFAQEDVETLARFAGVPVWNGLTDQWHPTQMLADVLTMRDHSTAPLEEVAYCYLGDARNNTANSLLVTGALLGADVRLAAPEELWPSTEVHDIAKRLAADIRRPSDDHSGRSRGGRGRGLPLHRRLALDGRARGELGEADRTAAPLPGERTELLKATGNPAVKFLHCLPALHDRETEIGKMIFKKWGLNGTRGDRRGLRIGRVDRVRPGREPDAHDQSCHGRHACGLTRTHRHVVVADSGIQ